MSSKLLKIRKNSCLVRSLLLHDRSWPLGRGLKTFWVDPNKITLFQTGNTDFPFDERGRIPLSVFGKVLPGSWDEKVSLINEMPLYRGVYQRFRLGMKWDDTDLHPSRMKTEHPASSTYCWMKKNNLFLHFKKNGKSRKAC